MKREVLAAEPRTKGVAFGAAVRKWFGHRLERWEELQRRYERELDGALDASAGRGGMTMTRPTHPVGEGTFDLEAVGRQMRREDAYLREGHTARTLAREPDLRIVVVVMRAGARIAEHRADATASIHALSGHLRVRLSDETVELASGRLLVLEEGVRHGVEAVEESAFLLTLGWKGS